MEYKNAIREILMENRMMIESQNLIERDYSFEQGANYVLMGIRRSGKTSLMQLQIKKLISQGIEWNQIAYINFEDERLFGLKMENLNDILEVQNSFTSDKSYYFFDEIQIVEGWEHFARRMADSHEYVWISGSNANMLGREISSRLGGRYMMAIIYPYSFAEFLKAKGKKDLLSQKISTAKRGERQKYFDEYLHTGGFPESLDYVDKRAYTQNVFAKIYQGDIALRHGVRNDYALRVMFRKLAEVVCNEISYSRLFNTIKSIGINVGKNSIINYVNYAKDSFLIFDVENYVYKLTEKECKPKYYYADNGLLNLFVTNRDSALLENIVAIDMHRKYDELLHYVKGKCEVDFYVPEIETAVQVAYSLNDDQTYKREIDGLKTLHKTWNLKQAIIVTYEESGEIQEGDLKIKIMPASEYLL